MPRPLGPGPGAYMLPTTVGYEKHDATRYRSPQYTMRAKCPFGAKPFGPGPQYTVSSVTRNGKLSPPSYTMAPKIKPLAAFKTPGPGTYSPEKAPRMKDIRPPAYSMAARVPPMKKFNTPGPNQYSVPSTIGPKVPNKPAAAAYTMSAKHQGIGKERSPGPAKYGSVSAEIYKNKSPQYTMTGRNPGVQAGTKTPGPAAYLPAFLEKVPGGISFGRRVDRSPYITAEDHMPCVD